MEYPKYLLAEPFKNVMRVLFPGLVVYFIVTSETEL